MWTRVLFARTLPLPGALLCGEAVVGSCGGVAVGWGARKRMVGL